jgi:hypothetical protein
MQSIRLEINLAWTATDIEKDSLKYVITLVKENVESARTKIYQDTDNFVTVGDD